MRLSLLVPAAIALGCIWAGLAIVMSFTEDYISSPEKILRMVNNAPWRNGKKPSPAERKQYLDELAKFYVMLDMEQRGRLREADTKGETMFFLAELTDSERKDYLAKILEAQFQPLMKAWPHISKEERRKILGASRSEMRRQGRDTTSLEKLAEGDGGVFDKIVEEGISEYYQGGDDNRKINLAPLMEELQARVQGIRRR